MKSLFVASLMLLATAPACATTFHFDFSFSNADQGELLSGTGTFTADDGVSVDGNTVYTLTGAEGTITPNFSSDPAVWTIYDIKQGFGFDPFTADNLLTVSNAGLASYTGLGLQVDGGDGFYFVHPDGVVAGEASYDVDSFSITQDGASASPTPEPATWAMLVGGFGLIGGAMRRRTTVRVAA